MRRGNFCTSGRRGGRGTEDKRVGLRAPGLPPPLPPLKGDSRIAGVLAAAHPHSRWSRSEPRSRKEPGSVATGDGLHLLDLRAGRAVARVAPRGALLRRAFASLPSHPPGRVSRLTPPSLAWPRSASLTSVSERLLAGRY